MTIKDPYQINALTLAYIGDAVYEQMVRRRLVENSEAPAGQLHKKAMNYVSAARQSLACGALTEVLREDERNIYMRARNASPAHTPRNTEIADYHRATALEAVFGYLYLSGSAGRLESLFELVYQTLSE